jgi:gas vesicle protein
MGADLEQEVENVIEQAEVRMRNKAGAFFLGMLVGAVVAGGVALLFAPQSGRETRAALKVELRTLGTNSRKVSVMSGKESAA